MNQYSFGLSLGPETGNSSMVTMERRADETVEGGYLFTVVEAERCPEGTPYSGVAEWVTLRLADYPMDQIVAIAVGGIEVDELFVGLLEEAGFGEKLELVRITD